MAHPSHGLPQKVSGAPGGVGAALPQPGHQHVAGAGGHGEERVIAPLAGVAMVPGPLLGQPVGLADGGIEVDGERRVAGSGTGGPGPASNSRLTRSSWRTWPHRKLRRNVPRVEGALTVHPSTEEVRPACSASASPELQEPTAGGPGTLWPPGWLRATPSIASCTRHGDEQRFSGCCCVDRCGPWMWLMVALAVFPERNRVSIRAKLDTSLRP